MLMLNDLALDMAHQLIAERLAEAAHAARAAQLDRDRKDLQIREPKLSERWRLAWSSR